MSAIPTNVKPDPDAGRGRRVYTMSDLPPVRMIPSGNMSAQIAAYFRRMLLSHAARGCECTIPSPCELTGLFGCNVMHILKGLQELERQDYEYELHALDQPVVIRDPNHRNRRNAQRWQSLSTELLRPWDTTRSHPTPHPAEEFPSWMKRL
jgi:DNA-binding transcriptional regulator YhcF (GntR family)